MNLPAERYTLFEYQLRT